MNGKSLERTDPKHVPVVYVVSRFPKLTETFILNEIAKLRECGTEVSLFPLIRGKEKVLQPGTVDVLRHTEYVVRDPGALLAAQIYWLVRFPLRYMRCWFDLRDLVSNPRRLARSGVAVLAGAVIARRLKKMGVKHVHAHWATYPTIAAMTAARLAGAEYSFTAHAHDLFMTQTLLTKKVARASFVVTISQFNKRFIDGVVGSTLGRKVRVIHCGVSPWIGPTRTRRLGSRPAHILSVGALEEKKGHIHLIDACALLIRGGVDIHCTIVGEGPLRSELLQQVSRLRLESSVSLIGACDRNGVAALMLGSDVLAVPSIPAGDGRMEGIPVVIMEAMNAGLPVVATWISGIPEIVEDCVSGLLVPPGDPTELSRALARAIEDAPLAMRLAGGGHRRVAEEFDLATGVGQLQVLFDGRSGPSVRQRSDAVPRIAPVRLSRERAVK